MSRILDIEGAEYNGVWRLWKLGSLGLFAAFVLILRDIARTLHRIEIDRRTATPTR